MRIGKYILTIAFLALSAGGFAQTFKFNGMLFRILTDSTVAVGNHDPYPQPKDTSSYYRKPENIPELVGDIVIPSKVEYKGHGYTVTEIGDSAFMNCYKILSISIPLSIIKIGDFAFYKSQNSTFSIPQSVQSIGENAFAYSELESIILPDTMLFIGKKAFYMCHQLSDIKIPYGIKTINEMCFACGFTYIDIPETVTYIDYCALTSDAFNLWGHSNRFIIICHAQKPPSGYDFLSFVYPHYSPGHFPQNYKLYVPSSSVELYKKAHVWSSFQTILPIEDSNIIYSPYHTILENNSYALDGQKLSAPRKGLNIVKMSDGTTRKVFVK